MHRMSVAEAVSYMRGLNRRSRQQWEQTRLLAGLVYKVLTGEDIDMEFPWDDEVRDEQEDDSRMTREEQQEMWAKARAMEEMVNRRGNL